jgi:putative transposase
MLRGNHREALFDTPDDRVTLNTLVADGLSRCRARLHAYCWMTNHLHMLVQISDVPLGKLMQRIAMRYSRYRHRALRSNGHLFDGRYKALLVDVDSYFLDLLRYIHLNPVAASIVDEPQQYPWSSHRVYLGEIAADWVTTDFGLSLFGTSSTVAIPAYRRFIDNSLCLPLLDPQCHTHADDPRVLGADTFITGLPPPAFKPRRRITLDQLATDICTRHRIPVERIRSPQRHRQLTAIRVEIAHAAIEGRIATLHTLAQYFHRDDSSLCKLIARHPVSPICQD